MDYLERLLKHFKFLVVIVMVIGVILFLLFPVTKIIGNAFVLSMMGILFLFSYKQGFDEDYLSKYFSKICLVGGIIAFLVILIDLISSNFDILFYLPAASFLISRVEYLENKDRSTK